MDIDAILMIEDEAEFIEDTADELIKNNDPAWRRETDGLLCMLFDFTPSIEGYDDYDDRVMLHESDEAGVVSYSIGKSSDVLKADAPSFTTSVDLAIRLIPSGARWSLTEDTAEIVWVDGDVVAKVTCLSIEDWHTPALVLVEAAMRCRARQMLAEIRTESQTVDQSHPLAGANPAGNA